MLAIKLGLGWLLTLAILVGPYAAICYYAWPFNIAYHILYWVIALTYLGYGFIIGVSITRDDLATASMPNPCSYEDEAAQRKIIFSLLLMPAIIMAWTMQVTWALILGTRD